MTKHELAMAVVVYTRKEQRTPEHEERMAQKLMRLYTKAELEDDVRVNAA